MEIKVEPKTFIALYRDPLITRSEIALESARLELKKMILERQKCCKHELLVHRDWDSHGEFIITTYYEAYACVNCGFHGLRDYDDNTSYKKFMTLSKIKDKVVHEVDSEEFRLFML